MPQPIDPHTELARQTLVERIQLAADRASIAAMQRQALRDEEMLALRESQVSEPENKSEEVDEELRRKNPFAGKRRKRDPKKNPAPDGRARTFYNAGERPEIAEDGDEHRLDVTI